MLGLRGHLHAYHRTTRGPAKGLARCAMMFSHEKTSQHPALCCHALRWSSLRRPCATASPQGSPAEERNNGLHYEDRKALPPRRLSLPLPEPNPDLAEGREGQRLHSV